MSNHGLFRFPAIYLLGMHSVTKEFQGNDFNEMSLKLTIWISFLFYFRFDIFPSLLLFVFNDEGHFHLAQRFFRIIGKGSRPYVSRYTFQV